MQYDLILWCVAIAASLWALTLFMQGRLHWLEVLTLECATLATLGAIGMVELPMVVKPMTMAVAIVFVAVRAMRTGGIGKFEVVLMLALAFSLAGDAFLAQEGYFIQGLASFLVAHLFYIALFRQGLAWFPSHRALATVLGVGAVMYAIVWPGLGDPVLKIAVAAYVTVISLMVAQAIGRATVLQDAGARWVALGTCVFMLSDALIAINKFVTPIALSSLWILVTYYMAQMLIVHFVRSRDR